MIRVRFIVSVEVEGLSEAECWRLFNEKLGNGEGTVDAQVLNRTPLMAPNDDTIPACRDGNTMPCSGVVVRNNIHQG